MTDYIWLSNPFVDTNIHYRLTSDQLERDRSGAFETADRNERGEPLEPSFMPTKIWPAANASKRDASPKGDLMLGAAMWFVSRKFAELLCEFDLGNGKLSPVAMCDVAGHVVSDGDWLAINFGNTKRLLIPEKSRTLMETFNKGEWITSPTTKDYDLCFNRDGVGGPDLWVDPSLFQCLCFSQKLGDAMRSRGIAGGVDGWRVLIKGKLV